MLVTLHTGFLHGCYLYPQRKGPSVKPLLSSHSYFLPSVVHIVLCFSSQARTPHSYNLGQPFPQDGVNMWQYSRPVLRIPVLLFQKLSGIPYLKSPAMTAPKDCLPAFIHSLQQCAVVFQDSLSVHARHLKIHHWHPLTLSRNFCNIQGVALHLLGLLSQCEKRSVDRKFKKM